MKTKVLPVTDPTSINLAAQVLKKGGLIAFPTDTVYGLAASISDSAAIDRLYQAKERSLNKSIAVLIGKIEQIDQVAYNLPEIARRLTKRFWPGALTLVVPRHPDLPSNLSHNTTIGVRMPDHDFTRDLLCKTGPLATTSANISGNINPRSAQDVFNQLDGRIELILDGGPTPGGIPSTVVDCTQNTLVILREGAITSEMLFD